MTPPLLVLRLALLKSAPARRRAHRVEDCQGARKISGDLSTERNSPQSLVQREMLLLQQPATSGPVQPAGWPCFEPSQASPDDDRGFFVEGHRAPRSAEWCSVASRKSPAPLEFETCFEPGFCGDPGVPWPRKPARTEMGPVVSASSPEPAAGGREPIDAGGRPGVALQIVDQDFRGRASPPHGSSLTVPPWHGERGAETSEAVITTSKTARGLRPAPGHSPRPL